ncbi:MAG: hypothetical protein ABSC23_05750 [Bryobacteraceae bacterium]
MNLDYKTAGIRQTRHELKLLLLYGPRYLRNRFLDRYPSYVQGSAAQGDFPDAEVHILTSTRDHVLALWAAATYYATSGRRDPLVIHEYDNLSAMAEARIKEHFPACRVIRRREADPLVRDRLAAFPRLVACRDRIPELVKLIDFALLCRTERLIVLDSDVLFSRNPVELSSPESPEHVFSRDLASVYSISPELAARSGFALAPRICCGLANINAAAVDFSYMERFLASGLVALDRCNQYIEQTLWALECGRSGFRYLPDSYAIRLAPPPQTITAQHYVGPVRHLFYTEGIPAARRTLAAAAPPN